MEIDITSLVTDGETWDFSGSVATHGPNAGPNTWANAKREAAERPLLHTEEQLQAMRQWMKETGAWDKAERDAMSDQELNALFIQLVSGDMREMGLDDAFHDEFDWDVYREENDGGGNIYRGDIEGSEGFGRYFYYLGS
jgi:hypothetical protein